MEIGADSPTGTSWCTSRRTASFLHHSNSHPISQSGRASWLRHWGVFLHGLPWYQLCYRPMLNLTLLWATVATIVAQNKPSSACWEKSWKKKLNFFLIFFFHFSFVVSFFLLFSPFTPTQPLRASEIWPHFSHARILHSHCAMFLVR